MLEISKTNHKSEVIESEIPVVLDFWAPWCGPCRSIGPVLEKLSGEFDGKVKVAKVNIDVEPELARAYQVQSIPTIVALRQGEVLDRSVGFRGEGPLRKMFEDLG